MSLTEGLLLLAAVVVAVLGAHSAWAAWRARPRRADAVGLADARRTEPALDEPTQAASAMAGAPPSADSAVDLPGRSVRARAAVHQIDAAVDAIAEVSLEHPLAGEAALAAMPATRRVGGKPMLIEGLNAETGQWEAPVHGQRYGAFQAGVLMANRSGALNEIEYSEFVHKTQAFADALGASLDVPDMMDVIARARELDEFGHAHDAQLAVHLSTRGPAWTVGFIRQTASRHGLVKGAVAGQLMLPSPEPEAPAVLMLTFDAQAALAEEGDNAPLRRCALTLDVPQSPQSIEPFALWQRTASALAADLDAHLHDDDGRPVSIQQFAAIHHELLRLYHALASRELAAGSVAARRLFS